MSGFRSLTVLYNQTIYVHGRSVDKEAVALRFLAYFAKFTNHLSFNNEWL